MVENYKQQSKEAVDFFKRLEDGVIRENTRTSDARPEQSSYRESQRKLANSLHGIMEVLSKLLKF